MLKRRRSTSPRVKIARIEYAKSKGMGRQPAAYRTIYSVTGSEDMQVFYMEIPSKSLNAFRKDDYKGDLHGRCCQTFPTTPQLLAKTTWFLYGKPTVIGSTIYTLGTKKLSLDTKKVLEIFTLKLNSRFKEWEPLLPFPLFEIMVTRQSVLASLRGRLYVLGAYPCFGAVFDPKTRIWSKLEVEVDPSKGVKLRTVDVTFIASLGDNVGKILVHDLDYTRLGFHSFIRLYDVDLNLCSTYDGQPLAYVDSLDIFDSPVLVSQDGNNTMLYFITTQGYICAFDWETRTLFEGSVSGFGEASLSSIPFSGTSFLHFGHDLFCLSYSTPYFGADCTSLHYVFIRVIKLAASLDAFVVGCLRNCIDGSYHPYGAFFV